MSLGLHKAYFWKSGFFLIIWMGSGPNLSGLWMLYCRCDIILTYHISVQLWNRDIYHKPRSWGHKCLRGRCTGIAGTWDSSTSPAGTDRMLCRTSVPDMCTGRCSHHRSCPRLPQSCSHMLKQSCICQKSSKILSVYFIELKTEQSLIYISIVFEDKVSKIQ